MISHIAIEYSVEVHFSDLWIGWGWCRCLVCWESGPGEIKLLAIYCIPPLRTLHVLIQLCVWIKASITGCVYCYQGTHTWIMAVDTIYLWDWDVEIGSEGEDCSCQQHHKNCKRCILTGCQLKLEWCTYVREHDINQLQYVCQWMYTRSPTSIVRNSTLHPMFCSGTGNLSRTICQLVVNRFCGSARHTCILQYVYMVIMGCSFACIKIISLGIRVVAMETLV